MLRIAALVALACFAAGCGEQTARVTPPTTTAAKPRVTTRADGLRVGLVGALDVRVAGAAVERGTLAEVADAPVVIATAERADGIRDAAVAHPTTHFAVTGASEREARLDNLTGLVLREDDAARLGGIVAGYVVNEESGSGARAAWVGPQERALAQAFVDGVHDVAPGTTVLRAWSSRRPAACKEAALAAIARGATVVMAHGGRCADAAIAGAHQQNHAGLRISDFQLPDVAAAQIVRDAVGGAYHGGEDIVFGATSGAIAIRRLDPRIADETAVRARAAAQELASRGRVTG